MLGLWLGPAGGMGARCWEPLAGPVEADETYVGGKANRRCGIGSVTPSPRLHDESGRASARLSAGSWPTTTKWPVMRQGRGSTRRSRALRRSRVTSGLVFASLLRLGQELSRQALLKVLRTNGIDSTAHWSRTSLRQWLLERSTATWAVAEACRAHTLVNSVEQAYVRQADVFDQRRDAMAAAGAPASHPPFASAPRRDCRLD